ncbi:unnamed protein product, partial [Ectocarpus sp. 12 AP-2014]
SHDSRSEQKSSRSDSQCMQKPLRKKKMGLFQVVCMGLLAAVAQTQTQNCSVSTSPLIVASTEDAGALATALQCSNGDFAVEWVGEVFVEEEIYVTNGTSLNIAGAGPGATADGGGRARLFHVDEGSSLYLSDMTFTNGNASSTGSGNGGAIVVDQATVSFTGIMSFISNYAGKGGGAIAARNSTVSWRGNGTKFSNNS